MKIDLNINKSSKGIKRLNKKDLGFNIKLNNSGGKNE
jgi:hypothetical protein